eukprot:symbB.v1.2.036319.t2/scaffold5101.1/size33394/1
MNMARELHELAQTDLDLIQDIQWNDLRRAVVIHLESLEEHDHVISHRIPTRKMCHHVINQKPCPKWTHGTHCEGTWHPEFLQILEDGHPKWIWMPRQTICRTDQRSKGTRHQQGSLSCTDPNCIRAHASNWLYAELWAFRWWVKHEFNTGLATGYTLDGDLIAMSTRTANLTLATMPYVDETYYHKFRWFAPIPQPEAHGDMMVTAPSRRANNLNEQPRRGRASTPRRNQTPRRPVTPSRPVVIRSTIHSIPASIPAPSSDPGPHDLTHVATRADTNPMTQSWNLISGFPTTPSPPRIPDTILGAWFERPPIQFTRQLPPTHIQGMPSLLRADSSFQLNSQLLTEFTSLLENHYPVSMGTWGTIIHGNMTPQVPGHQHFDRLQLIPMASETSTADASLLKFWWHQHLLIARNVAQERFANSSAGPTIISDHLQAFLLTAINLMRLARPVGPPFELRQPEGPALASLAETLLETLQGTMTMEMKMGIATGHIGELVLEGDHNNCRLVFYRTQTWTGPPRQRSMSSTQRSHDDEVEV